MDEVEETSCPHPATRMHVRKPGGVLIRKEFCEVCGEQV